MLTIRCSRAASAHVTTSRCAATLTPIRTLTRTTRVSFRLRSAATHCILCPRRQAIGTSSTRLRMLTSTHSRRRQAAAKASSQACNRPCLPQREREDRCGCQKVVVPRRTRSHSSKPLKIIIKTVTTTGRHTQQAWHLSCARRASRSRSAVGEVRRAVPPPPGKTPTSSTIKT